MNSFTDSKQGFEGARPVRTWLAPAVVFVICLALGTVVVIWRAQAEANLQGARAQAEAAARVTALELQFSRLLSAADVLASSVRQGGGAIPGFQKTADELHAALPDIASLELQPGGTVSEIVPRSGNERGIGFNALNDPAHRVSANLAMRSGGPVVSAPLILYNGAPGLVVRVPISQKGRSGGEQFWGFVAVSMRFSEAFRRAGLDELSKGGWDYLLFAPATRTAKAVALARRGLPELRGAIVQPVRVQNLELRLAVRRHGAWIDTSRVLTESLLVLVGSVVFSGLAYLLAGRRQVAAALTEAQLQLNRERLEREQTQAALANSSAKTAGDLSATRTALEQAREQIIQGTQALAVAAERQQTVEADLKRAEHKASDLQKRLDQAVRVHREELAAAEASLAQARSELKGAEEKAHAVEKAAAAALKARDDAGSGLEAQKEGMRTQIAELQSRLDREKRGAEAVAMKLKEAEASNNELEVQLAEAKRGLAEATDLVAQLRSAAATATTTDESTEVDTPPPTLPEDEPDPAGSGKETAETEAAAVKRKRARRKDDKQIDLFSDERAPAPPTSFAQPLPPTPSIRSTASASPTIAREAIPPRRVDESELRRAVNEILPLLSDGDPGAKDCLKANRTLFRSALGSLAFDEFEQLIKDGTFDTALERLTKLARKHGIHI